MKICWDNLEKLEYRYEKDAWQDKKWKAVFYVYKNSCKTCGDPFLAQKYSKGIFCDNLCINKGKNNSFYGKYHSKETKRKMSKNKEKENNPNYKGGYDNNISLYDTFTPQISFCEEARRNKDDLNILEVKCAYCGKWYKPTINSINNRIRALNGTQAGEQRLYCSTQCKKECPIYHKSKWPDGFKPATSREVQPELRQMCFERDNFTCQKCDKTQAELKTGLHCHHVEGIRWEPLESADLDKVITLCKTCHKEVHKLPDCGYNDLMCRETKDE